MNDMSIDDRGFIELSEHKVKLRPYVPRPLKPVEYLTDDELIQGVGGTLIADTECFVSYFLIGFKCIKTNKYLALEIPFNAQKLSWIMHNYTIVGFNWIKYDSCMVWASFSNQNCQKLKELSDEIILGGMWYKEAQEKFNFKIYPTKIIDLLEVCPLRGSLKLYGARLHSPRIQELPISAHKELTAEEMHIVKHYNYNDLDVTHLAFDNLTEQLKLRQNLSAEYKTDLMSKSDAQIAESVIGYELKKITGYWPKKPDINSQTFGHHFQVPQNLFFQTDYMKDILEKIKKIKFTVQDNGRLDASEMNDIRVRIGSSTYRMGTGGLHSSEECRALKSDKYIIKDIDMVSYYPRIVINQKLYPKHLGPLFTQVYEGITNRRIDAKKNKRMAESENLKVTINGTFGKTGSPFSFLYAPEMTIQITVGGQLYLLMFIETLELNDIPIASANTDGIVALCPHDKLELLTNLTKQFEKITGFETEETEYEAIYSRDVNAYLAIKKKKDVFEFKGKNDYYNPWREDRNAKDAYWRFQKNPTHQICVEAIEKLISEGIAPEITIKACKDITKFVCVKNVKGGAHKNGEYLGKVIRWYYAVDMVGTINYVTSNNKVPESDGAKPCMDLPEILPDDIDYGWYIDKTKVMLEDCGYLKKVQQVRFF